jgi:hypothetical protein
LRPEWFFDGRVVLGVVPIERRFWPQEVVGPTTSKEEEPSSDQRTRCPNVTLQHCLKVTQQMQRVRGLHGGAVLLRFFHIDGPGPASTELRLTSLRR